jgi:hypothetical protein
MSTSAIIMLIFGATLLWGGLALSVLVYVRASRRERLESQD